MRFWDIFKISIHNIFNNKLRTLLVTLVLFILCTIVMLVGTAGVNVVKMMNASFYGDEDIYADMRLRYRNYFDLENLGAEYKDFSKDEIDKLLKHIDKEYSYLQNVTFDSEFNGPYEGHITMDSVYAEIVFTDFSRNLLAGGYDYLVDGRLWNKSDVGENNVWITPNIAKNFNLKVGDKITFSRTKKSNDVESNFGMNFTEEKFDMKIGGIVKYERRYWSNTDYVFFDFHTALDMGEKFDYIQFTQSKLAKGGATMAQLNQINKFAKKYGTYHYEKNPDGLDVYSDAYETRLMMVLLTAGIIAAVLFVAVVIILLSIGCVSNSIQITVEQNAKFFGMMKAVGMRNGVVKSIVRIQALVSIFVAVLLATIVTVTLFFVFKPMLAGLLASMYITIELTMPFYIPIAVFALMAAMVMLFTIKSLNRISKMDVVSVISEVN